MTDDAPESPDRPFGRDGTSRRRFLRSAGLVTGGLAVGGGAGAAIAAHDRSGSTGAGAIGAVQTATTVAFHGVHQAGIVDRPPAELTFLSLDLTPTTLSGGATALRTLLQTLSRAAESMTAGRWLAEQAHTLDGINAAGLTVTVGVGARAVRLAGRTIPAALAPLPAFTTDQLQPGRSGGDLAVQICAEDPLVTASVARSVIRLLAPYATVRWTQRGFLRAAGSGPDAAATPRNLMGQLDGTNNPTGSKQELAVWVPTGAPESWLVGGSYLVARRIRMLLDDWDSLAPTAQERVIGRRLDTGAPLSGGEEHSTPAFNQTDADKQPAIPADAHIRLTNPAHNAGATMFRRGYAYDEGIRADGHPAAGLFFQAYQTDPHAVFVPVQQKLAASDALSRFIRHEGSAVFAILPGVSAGGWLGQTLFPGG